MRQIDPIVQGGISSKPLHVVSVGFSLILGISLLSRWIYPFFGLVVLLGITAPLLWARLIRDWSSIGFSRQSIGRALIWGIGAGSLSSVFGLAMLPEFGVADELGIQLLIAVPFWFLLISPFQEFFFRGWMQTILVQSMGKWQGLLIANLCFTIWHYATPLVDLSSFPLTSLGGLGATFAAGLLYAYAYHQSQNIIAPWLGHAISGIAFAVVGAMDFITALK